MDSIPRSRALATLPGSLLLAILAAPSAAIAQPPAAAVPQETQDTMKLAAPLRAARAEMTAAYVALNATAAGRFFADSAVVNFQGEVLAGRAAVDGWLANSLQGVSALKFGTSTFVVAETVVTERSTYTVVLPEGGEQSGYSESIWQRQADGSWKVVRLTVS